MSNPSDDQIIQELKVLLRTQYMMTMAAETTAPESKFGKYHGVPTWHLKIAMAVPTSVLRPRLKKLAEQGKVICELRNGNQLRWWPVGLLDELRASSKAAV